MDRLKINTKALLGMATRTVDQEHERRHSCVKALNHALIQYESAMSKFTTTLSTIASSLEMVEKAYKDVIVDEKEMSICVAAKEVTERIECIRSNVFEHFVEGLKASVSPVLSPLRTDSEVCDKIHNERAKAVDLYDYNRDVVEKKEVQYASKGKLLDDSKRYKEELHKRDASKEEYLAKHEEYNNAYDQFLSHKSEQTLLSLKAFVHCFFDFSKKLSDETRIMCDTVDRVDIQETKDKNVGPLCSEAENRNSNTENLNNNGAEETAEDGGRCSDPEDTPEGMPKVEVCAASNVEGESKEIAADPITDQG